MQNRKNSINLSFALHHAIIIHITRIRNEKKGFFLYRIGTSTYTYLEISMATAITHTLTSAQRRKKNV